MSELTQYDYVEQIATLTAQLAEAKARIAAMDEVIGEQVEFRGDRDRAQADAAAMMEFVKYVGECLLLFDPHPCVKAISKRANEQFMDGDKLKPHPGTALLDELARLRKELALIREAANDTTLTDAVVRVIAQGVDEVTDEDIKWAQDALRQREGQL